MRGTCVPPRAAPVAGAAPRFLLREPPLDQLPRTGANPCPAPPDQAAQFAPCPAVEVLKDILSHGFSIVVGPPAKERIEILHNEALQVAALPLPKHLPGFDLKAFHRLGRCLQARPAMHRHAVAKKLAVPRTTRGDLRCYAKAQLRLRGCGKALERSAEGIAERGDTPKGPKRSGRYEVSLRAISRQFVPWYTNWIVVLVKPAHPV